MALELVRKFIAGHGWNYVAEEEAVGGGAALTVTGDTGEVMNVDTGEVMNVDTLNLVGASVVSGAAGVADASLAIRTVGATLDNDQIKSLPTTPVEILAAPPEGTFYVPLLMVLYCDTSDFAYGNIGAESFIFDLSGQLNVIHQQVDDGVELLLANFAPTYLVMAAAQRQFPTDDNFLYAAGFEASSGGISLSANNGSGPGDFTGGDPSMSLIVRLAYYAIDLTA